MVKTVTDIKQKLDQRDIMKDPLAQIKHLLLRYGSANVDVFIGAYETNKKKSAANSSEPSFEPFFEQRMSEENFHSIFEPYAKAHHPNSPLNNHPKTRVLYLISDDVLRVLLSAQIFALLLNHQGEINLSAMKDYTKSFVAISPHAANALVHSNGQRLIARNQTYIQHLALIDAKTSDAICANDQALDIDEDFLTFLANLPTYFNNHLAHYHSHIANDNHETQLWYHQNYQDCDRNSREDSLSKQKAIAHHLGYSFSHAAISEHHGGDAGFRQFLYFCLTSVFIRQALTQRLFLERFTDLTLNNSSPLANSALHFYVKTLFFNEARVFHEPARLTTQNPIHTNAILQSKEQFLRVAMQHGLIISLEMMRQLLSRQAVISQQVFAVLDNAALIQLLNTRKIPLNAILIDQATLGLQALCLPEVKTWFAKDGELLWHYLFGIVDPEVLAALRDKKNVTWLQENPITWGAALCGNGRWRFIVQLLDIPIIRQKIATDKTGVIWQQLARAHNQFVIDAFKNPLLIEFLQSNPDAWESVFQISSKAALDVLALEDIYDCLDQKPYVWHDIFNLKNTFAAEAFKEKAVLKWVVNAILGAQAKNNANDQPGYFELTCVLTIKNQLIVDVLKIKVLKEIKSQNDTTVRVATPAVMDLVKTSPLMCQYIFAIDKPLVVDLLKLKGILNLLTDDVLTALIDDAEETQQRGIIVSEYIFEKITDRKSLQALSEPLLIARLADKNLDNSWMWKYIARISNDALVNLITDQTFLNHLEEYPQDLRNAFDHYDFVKSAYLYLKLANRNPDSTFNSLFRVKVSDVQQLMKSLKQSTETEAATFPEKWLRLFTKKGKFRDILIDNTVYTKEELKAFTCARLLPLLVLTHAASTQAFAIDEKERSLSLSSTIDLNGSTGKGLKVGVNRHLKAIIEEVLHSDSEEDDEEEQTLIDSTTRPPSCTTSVRLMHTTTQKNANADVNPVAFYLDPLDPSKDSKRADGML